MSAGASTAGPSVGAALFTDLVGFTAYTDSVGDEAAVGVLDRQSEIVGSVLDDGQGRVVKELGDGLMIWFETADSGLASAVQLMEAIDDARRAGSFPLAVRMGLHHGEAIARGDDLVGQTINIAARVSALPGPGELLVSDEVTNACGATSGGFAMSPIGPVSVKGVSEPVWLQRVDLR